MLQTILILIPYFLFSFCFSTLTYSKDLVSTDLENAEQFPYESWVYMGLSDEGGFNPNDVEYMLLSQIIKASKSQAAKAYNSGLPIMAIKACFN